VVIIKFLNTDVLDFIPYKDFDNVYVKVIMKNEVRILTSPYEGKIFHWKATHMRYVSYILFFHVDEVFGMSQVEKKKIFNSLPHP
jgi:hypothetical protein